MEWLENLLSRPMEKVYTFTDIKEVKRFIEDLKASFHLTPFEVVLPFMGEYDLLMKIHYGKDGCDLFFDQEMVEDELVNFDFLWYTTSGHLVHIGYEKTERLIGADSEEFYLRLGTDESEYFYPSIAGMLGLVKKELVGETAEGRKVYRHSFREQSSLDVYPLEGEVFYESWDDTEENFKKLIAS